MSIETKQATIIEFEIDSDATTYTAERTTSTPSAEIEKLEIKKSATIHPTGTTTAKIGLRQQYDCDNNIHAFYWDDDEFDGECANPNCGVGLTSSDNYTYDATTGLYKYDDMYYSTCRAL